LLQSKEMVEKLPSMLKQNVPKDEAEALVAKFKELGGTVELK
jgi:ribosomal protein L7/L12